MLLLGNLISTKKIKEYKIVYMIYISSNSYFLKEKKSTNKTKKYRGYRTLTAVKL